MMELKSPGTFLARVAAVVRAANDEISTANSTIINALFMVRTDGRVDGGSGGRRGGTALMR